MESIPRKFSPEEYAQLTSLQQRQAGRQLDAALAAAEIKLRQWCMEQAVNLWLKDTSVHKTPESMAKAILDFVTAPLKEDPNG
jgi:hypothetical protein